MAPSQSQQVQHDHVPDTTDARRNIALGDQYSTACQPSHGVLIHTSTPGRRGGGLSSENRPITRPPAPTPMGTPWIGPRKLVSTH